MNSGLFLNSIIAKQHVILKMISDNFATMSYFRAFSFLIFCLFLLSNDAVAQRPSLGCIDKGIRLQADEIKRFYTDQGMLVYRDAMINMSSMEPFPIMAEMQKGQLYMIIFVGLPAVYRLKMEIFDSGDNKITEQSAYRNRQQPNYIIYNFVPEHSDVFLLTLMQKLKNEDMCGSLCILKVDPNKPSMQLRPYQP